MTEMKKRYSEDQNRKLISGWSTDVNQIDASRHPLRLKKWRTFRFDRWIAWSTFIAWPKISQFSRLKNRQLEYNETFYVALKCHWGSKIIKCLVRKETQRARKAKSVDIAEAAWSCWPPETDKKPTSNLNDFLAVGSGRSVFIFYIRTSYAKDTTMSGLGSVGQFFYPWVSVCPLL